MLKNQTKPSAKVTHHFTSQLPSPSVGSEGWSQVKSRQLLLWTWRYSSQLPTWYADLPRNSHMGVFINNKAMYSSQVRLDGIPTCGWDESSGFHSPLHPLSRDDEGAIWIYGPMFDHRGPLSSNLDQRPFHVWSISHWHFRLRCSKACFWKTPNNGALHLQHQQESFSVCSSDSKLDSEEPSSNCKWGILSYIRDPWNMVFRELVPPIKVGVLHN